jgi:hypothetical protein
MTWSDALKTILQRFSPQWISMALDVIDSIQKYVQQKEPEGLYEILEYETKLELLDARGHRAALSKHQRVKFLQDNVIAFQDYAWGEGNVLASYDCAPGIVADRYREGERWNILISLRGSKQRGEVEDFYIERKLVNTFTQKDEWWQIEMQHRTRQAKLELVFPKKRHCTQATIVERNRSRTIVLDAKNFRLLADGRQLLTWETMEPRRFETYTVKWSW